MFYTAKNCIIEIPFQSQKAYTDPFNDAELDVIFIDSSGSEQRVPAFWAGGQTWRVRFAPSQTGEYQYHTLCSAAGDAGLHGQKGTIKVTPYEGTNPLLQRGGLRVAANRRHLEHTDAAPGSAGTPFLWLADTWWMAFCKRLSFPDDFRELLADRVQKGFSVVQIIAGLYPDMEPFDERGANEAGYPWEKDFSRINPEYFDMTDLRIAALVGAGITPCIVGFWGYFMDFAGAEVLKKHWRYLIARYSAYPVVWCTAGEALMEYYLAQNEGTPEERKRKRQEAWTDMVQHIRALDAFHRPVSIHPTNFGHEQVSDASVLDFDMLQTGHGGYTSLAPTVDNLLTALAHEPKMPVLVSEVDYEGILEGSREEVQRFHFWSCLLSGAMGHTYGANGLWQLNTREKPYGPSPHGTSWGNIPWQDACNLPGSGQLGLGKKLLERYEWQRMEPHLEWVSHPQTAEDRIKMYAAGIPGELRIVFFPAGISWAAWRGEMKVLGLEDGVSYRTFLFDPKTGQETALGTVTGGEFVFPKPPIFQDWVLVMEKVK